jgi:hypothetical protein
MSVGVPGNATVSDRPCATSAGLPTLDHPLTTDTGSPTAPEAAIGVCRSACVAARCRHATCRIPSEVRASPTWSDTFIPPELIRRHVCAPTASGPQAVQNIAATNTVDTTVIKRFTAAPHSPAMSGHFRPHPQRSRTHRMTARPRRLAFAHWPTRTSLRGNRASRVDDISSTQRPRTHKRNGVAKAFVNRRRRLAPELSP